MRNLHATLSDYDVGMLPALAQVWDVNIGNLNTQGAVDVLSAAMLVSEHSVEVWEKLSDAMRSAMQLLISSKGHRMSTAQFERVFGEIRKMGRAQIEREKPHLQPATVAEGLYYRGLIAEGFDKNDKGLTVPMIYVAPDLVEVLPLHKTAYENLDDEEAFPEEELPTIEEIQEVENIHAADTSIVDDMTTLLAYLQMFNPRVEGRGFHADELPDILLSLLTQGDIRLNFLLGVGVSANLITTQDGKAYPRRDEARQWLNLSRSQQVHGLATAWLSSSHYQDLFHIPGLYPEDSGWSYDAVLARNSIMSLFTEMVPEQGWISVTSLIDKVKDVEPDFQRPEGDYDSWYIRNEAGEYLRGFDSWDAVEGALIEFYMMGPMHWLGLLDVADDAIRLTAYGRAFLEIADWPQLPDSEEKITIKEDGTMLASRRANRFDRFQLARFTTWVQIGDPYVYKLDAEGIKRANHQSITVQHIQAFVARQLDGGAIPAQIVTLLKNWQGGASAAVTIEQLLVIRTTSPELMERIFNDPPLRRFLGARLGPMACTVRADQLQALKSALGEQGIDVE